jgi:uncharacterized protein (DUF2267 family)
MIVDRGSLLEDVMWRSGLRDQSRAETAVETVLETLACVLTPADARFVARDLPERLARKLAAPARRDAPTPDDLYARLAAAERVSRGSAREHAEAACAALADCFGAEPRTLLGRRLPPDWAALFVPPARAPEADVPHGTMPGHGHTLATGRPGSSRSVAGDHPRQAQSDSVVSSDNPHEDSKLSSGHDAAVDPLASAQPGAEEPISEAKDERRRR